MATLPIRASRNRETYLLAHRFELVHWPNSSCPSDVRRWESFYFVPRQRATEQRWEVAAYLASQTELMSQQKTRQEKVKQRKNQDKRLA